jgi:hypothetical protein
MKLQNRRELGESCSPEVDPLQVMNQLHVHVHLPEEMETTIMLTELEILVLESSI